MAVRREGAKTDRTADQAGVSLGPGGRGAARRSEPDHRQPGVPHPARRSRSGTRQEPQGSAKQTQVIRAGVLFVLLLIIPAHAQTVAVPPGFDAHLITSVYATALAFMAPRTLQPVAVSQLTLW